LHLVCYAAVSFWVLVYITTARKWLVFVTNSD